MNRTIKTYPQITTLFRGGDLEIMCRLETWVRVKRKGKYWKVLVTDSFPISTIGDNSDSPKELQEFDKALSRFHDVCLRTKYLYILPDKKRRKIDIKEGRLKEDVSHLTDKEEFLLNLKLL